MSSAAVVGDWLLEHMAALVAVELALGRSIEDANRLAISHAAAASIWSALADPEWAHALAKAIDDDCPEISAIKGARWFREAFPPEPT